MSWFPNRTRCEDSMNQLSNVPLHFRLGICRRAMKQKATGLPLYSLNDFHYGADVDHAPQSMPSFLRTSRIETQRRQGRASTLPSVCSPEWRIVPTATSYRTLNHGNGRGKSNRCETKHVLGALVTSAHHKSTFSFRTPRSRNLGRLGSGNPPHG